MDPISALIAAIAPVATEYLKVIQIGATGVLDIVRNKIIQNNKVSESLKADKEYAQTKEFLLYQSALDKQAKERMTLLIITILIIAVLAITIIRKNK